MSSGRRNEILLSIPSIGWLAIFFLLPTLLVMTTAFKGPDPYGGIAPGWTLSTFGEIGNAGYGPVAWRTLWMSLVSTAVCVSVSIPTAYYISRLDKKYRDIVLFMVIVPFWINFLIRIFAWKVLLHPDGYFRHALAAVGLADRDSILLYRPEAVLAVIIYSYLPFAMLPVYAAAEKFDYHLIEAARDLGAGRLQAFIKIFLPGIRQGIVTACIVVFIPVLGSYIIPDLVGGSASEMIGNKIAQRTFVDRNLPHAAALSAILAAAVMVPAAISLTLKFIRGRSAGSAGL